MEISKNYSLLQHNTFGMNVKAKYFAEYSSKNELMEILSSTLFKENKSFHIGGGSNLLFKGDYDGIILHSAINFIEKTRENEDNVWLKAGAGVEWDCFCEYCVTHNYYGSENLSLIPGEVGASAVQNIGAYGVEACDIIDEVECVEIDSLNERVFKNIECGYGYRDSVFKKSLKGKYIVTAVVYKLMKKPCFKLEYGNIKNSLAGKDINLKNIRETIIEIRRNKLPDPHITGNAGSFFMNPVVTMEKFNQLQTLYPLIPHYNVSSDKEKIPAAWLIEQCGWKGKEFGGAAVHDKQCLVLVNKNNALWSDVVSLANEICRSVKDKFDIDISPEVIYL
ncbi:MAG: UDP-N-acetylmuramate dehydrogenase [Bacteroidales bacterium]|nr:UDP-N-acetylmuramate dehydrogenase [Bacteroidales bacterium]